MSARWLVRWKQASHTILKLLHCYLGTSAIETANTSPEKRKIYVVAQPLRNEQDVT